ncbi:MAG: glycosyltransferase family 87 protein [Anaerolineales bacterium]
MTLVITYAILWLQMISSPAQRTGADFMVFFTAGRISQINGSALVYNTLLQQTIQQAAVGFQLAPGQVLIYNHVPYLIPILKVFISGNYVASFYRWGVLLLVLYLAGMVLLTGVLRQAGWRQAETWLMAAGMITFFPCFVSLLNGQDTAFTFFGLCLYLAGFLTGRDWLAGVGLALTSIRPQVMVLLAVPFIFRRQKVFGWFCLAGGVLGGVSLAAVGVEGMRGFLNLLLVSAGGEWYGLKEPLMVNLVGLLWRIAPGLSANVIHWTGWMVYGMTLIGLCILWRRTHQINEKQIGLAIVLAVFTVPHLHYHDLALLLVALVAALLILVREGFLNTQKAALGPLALSIVFLLSNFTQISKLNFPYLIMLLLGLALYFPGVIFRGKKSAYERQPDGIEN